MDAIGPVRARLSTETLRRNAYFLEAGVGMCAIKPFSPFTPTSPAATLARPPARPLSPSNHRRSGELVASDPGKRQVWPPPVTRPKLRPSVCLPLHSPMAFPMERRRVNWLPARRRGGAEAGQARPFPPIHLGERAGWTRDACALGADAIDVTARTPHRPPALLPYEPTSYGCKPASAPE